ncbi:MAG: hypothetical protein O7C58_00495 [Rickettsia endosymbiont of Ixodes persulcatus]|nr:hypothetical protein [Rickettsia endosymbiont of Ixodes persulcatus]
MGVDLTTVDEKYSIANVTLPNSSKVLTTEIPNLPKPMTQKSFSDEDIYILLP